MAKTTKQEVEKFTKRHQFKPGITGLAQTRGFRGKIYGFYDMSSRVRLDRYYFKNWSIFIDLKICLKTILGILKIPSNFKYPLKPAFTRPNFRVCPTRKE